MTLPVARTLTIAPAEDAARNEKVNSLARIAPHTRHKSGLIKNFSLRCGQALRAVCAFVLEQMPDILVREHAKQFTPVASSFHKC